MKLRKEIKFVELIRYHEVMASIFKKVSSEACQQLYEHIRIALQGQTKKDLRVPDGLLSLKAAVLLFIDRLVTNASFREMAERYKVPKSTLSRDWEW